ncbi:MarR family transcriptional regulator [Bombiscardovia nodaiensis]|uniref:MarR family transcriptional regulator n=1 Tax=Bombiscardovia nodaiensis TaxID=2932181 RepID=A0ABM8B7F1_9BIFI|nr:MarR family transcriptional regulator [Bombiscardovia nodaiensis]
MRNLFDSYGYSLGKASQAMGERFAPSLEPYGLDSREFGVLCFIGRNPGISQADIGQMMRVDRTTMVTIIDHLERHKYCKRVRSLADRRSYAINLTQSGRRLVKDLWTVMRQCEDEALEALPQEVQSVLLGIAAHLQQGKQS